MFIINLFMFIINLFMFTIDLFMFINELSYHIEVCFNIKYIELFYQYQMYKNEFIIIIHHLFKQDY
jgi:hypothetical protein